MVTSFLKNCGEKGYPEVILYNFRSVSQPQRTYHSTASVLKINRRGKNKPVLGLVCMATMTSSSTSVGVFFRKSYLWHKSCVQNYPWNKDPQEFPGPGVGFGLGMLVYLT